MSSKHNTGFLPIITLLIGASFWGVSWYPLRFAEDAGFHGLWTTLIAYGATCLLGVIIFFRRLPEIRLAPAALMLIGIASAWCNIAFILAILDGNVVRVVLLFYLSPIWTTLLGWLILRESFSRLDMFTLCLAMLGAMVMLWDPALGMPWPREASDWFAISSGVAFSLTNIGVRRLQHVSVQIKTLSIWFYVSLLALVWILITAVPAPEVPPSYINWTILVGVAMIITMTLTVQHGITHMPAHRSAIILLFELVVAVISSQLLTNEVIESGEWLGGLLIMFAAFLSARSYINNVGEEDRNEPGQATGQQ